MPEKKTSTQEDIEKNKIVAVLSYLWILFLVPLLATKSPYAHFHAKQGLVLFLLWIISGAILMIPFIGWIIGWIGYLAAIILMIIGLVNALGGKMEKLPLIGNFADKFNI